MQPLGNLAQLLRANGATVLEMPGWQDKSEGSFTPRGILLHHDGMGLGYRGPLTNNVAQYMSGAGVNGAQTWVRRDGLIALIKAGRANHAGLGTIPGLGFTNNGNQVLTGIETDHYPGDPWEPQQVAAIDLLTRVLWENYPHDLGAWAHKEYAPGRKDDPENFDLNAWRARITQPMTVEDDMYDAAARNELIARIDGYNANTSTALTAIIKRLDDYNYSQQQQIKTLQSDVAALKGAAPAVTPKQ